MPVSSLVSHFGDSAGTHFGTLREVWVFGEESHWLPGLRGPGGLGSENPKQLPSDFPQHLGILPLTPATSHCLSHLMESLDFLVQVKIWGHSLDHLVKVPFWVTELGLKK